MNSKEYGILTVELKKMKGPQDIVKISLRNGRNIEGLLLESIVDRMHLEDGVDTFRRPTKFRIQVLVDSHPEFGKPEEIVEINSIAKLEVVNM